MTRFAYCTPSLIRLGRLCGPAAHPGPPMRHVACEPAWRPQTAIATLSAALPGRWAVTAPGLQAALVSLSPGQGSRAEVGAVWKLPFAGQPPLLMRQSQSRCCRRLQDAILPFSPAPRAHPKLDRGGVADAHAVAASTAWGAEGVDSRNGWRYGTRRSVASLGGDRVAVRPLLRVLVSLSHTSTVEIHNTASRPCNRPQTGDLWFDAVASGGRAPVSEAASAGVQAPWRRCGGRPGWA